MDDREYKVSNDRHKLYKDTCYECDKLMWRRKRALGTMCKSCASGQNADSLHGFGESNPNWKGGRIKHAKGYIMIRVPGHHRSDKKGYVMEHIVVAEEMIGRKLNNNEQVHHKNEVKDDNRPENLQVMTASEHSSHHSNLTKHRRK